MKKSMHRFKHILIISASCLMLTAVYFVGYSAGMSSPPTNPGPVSFADAQRFTNKYLRNAPYQFSGTVNALVIDLQQYNAMTQVLQNSVGTTGFRLYYGIDDSNQPVRIVAGRGPNGMDNTNYLILSTTSSNGICPPVCDSPSGALGQ